MAREKYPQACLTRHRCLGVFVIGNPQLRVKLYICLERSHPTLRQPKNFKNTYFNILIDTWCEGF